MEVTVKADAAKAAVALAQFRLSLQDKSELLKVLGAGQLNSIYRTFDEQGPGWPGLSDASLSWNKKYTTAHMLLQNSGHGRTSIGWEVSGDSVAIGTSLWYMKLQQEGWEGTQNVAGYQYSRAVASRDQFGNVVITNKRGRQQNVHRKMVSGVSFVTVHPFERHITIPARPFLVFRPEDPARMEAATRAFVAERARGAGLEMN
jgi:phage gpG-like protein